MLTPERYAELSAHEEFVLDRVRERLRQAHVGLRIPHLRPWRQRHHRHDRQSAERQLIGSFPVEERPDHAGHRPRQLIRLPGRGHQRHGPLDQGVIIFDTAEGERVVSVEHIPTWRAATAMKDRRTKARRRRADDGPLDDGSGERANRRRAGAGGFRQASVPPATAPRARESRAAPGSRRCPRSAARRGRATIRDRSAGPDADIGRQDRFAGIGMAMRMPPAGAGVRSAIDWSRPGPLIFSAALDRFDSSVHACRTSPDRLEITTSQTSTVRRPTSSPPGGPDPVGHFSSGRGGPCGRYRCAARRCR